MASIAAQAAERLACPLPNARRGLWSRSLLRGPLPVRNLRPTRSDGSARVFGAARKPGSQRVRRATSTRALRETDVSSGSPVKISPPVKPELDRGTKESAHDVEDEPGFLGGRLARLSAQWREVPEYQQLVVGATFAFVLNNMDKVNMSVAVIPMSRDLAWTATTAGLVQSSFFWGYCLVQLPGGWIVSKLSGRRILPVGVMVWSLATAAVPFVAGSLPALCVSRALVGLGEGIGPTSVLDLVAKNVPITERSRATALIFSGLNVGAVTGLVVAPLMIGQWNWESVFIVFGLLGVVWWFAFDRLIGPGSDAASLKDLVEGLFSGTADEGKGAGGGAVAKAGEQRGGAASPATTIVEAELVAGGAAEEAKTGGGGAEEEAVWVEQEEGIPWRQIIRTPAFLALTYTHFCNNWGHFTLLAWLPTYFSQLLGLDLSNAALVSLLPPVSGIVAASFAAPLADRMVAEGTPVRQVRKAAQAVAFMGPAVCLVAGALSDNHVVTVALTSIGVGLSSFSLAGLYCNHQDLSPTYAAVLLGMTNTVGALPGLIGVAFAGMVYDQTQSWELAMFAPSVFFYVTGTMVFTAWGSGELQPFDPTYQKEGGEEGVVPLPPPPRAH